MRIQSINSTQSFGMACQIGDDVVKAVEKMAENPKNIAKMQNLKKVCMALEEMPGDYFVWLSGKNQKAFRIGSLRDGNILKSRLYKKINPEKVIKMTCQDVGAAAYKNAEKAAAQDFVQSLTQFFNVQ